MPHRVAQPLPPVLRPRNRTLHLRCAGCGFGATVHTPPLRCPICGRHDWLVVDRHGVPAPSPDRTSGEDVVDNLQQDLTEAAPGGLPRLKTYKL